MRAIGLLAAAAVLSACATVPPPLKLEVVGPYAKQLSKSDVQQIIAVVGSTPKSRTTYININATGRNEALLNYTEQRLLFGLPTDLEQHVAITVTKHQGKWIHPKPTETVILN